MLKKLKVETEMSKTYIDDNTVAMKSVDAGVRFDAERMNMAEFVESDKEIPEDKRPMIELNKIANTIYECVQFTTDCPSNHQEGEGKMPVFFSIIYFSLSFRADALKVVAFGHQLGLQQK